MKTEDFRITQYALGELHGKDREEFERELAASEELQQELEQTIAMSDRLAELPKGNETLTDRQRESLRHAFIAEYANKRQRDIRRTFAYAALFIGAGLLVAYLGRPSITSALTKPSPALLADLEARRGDLAQGKDEKVLAEPPPFLAKAAATPPSLGLAEKPSPAGESLATQPGSASASLALSVNGLPAQENSHGTSNLIAENSAPAAGALRVSEPASPAPMAPPASDGMINYGNPIPPAPASESATKTLADALVASNESAKFSPTIMPANNLAVTPISRALQPSDEAAKATADLDAKVASDSRLIASALVATRSGDRVETQVVREFHDSSDKNFEIYRVSGDSVQFLDGRTMSREELTARSRSTAQTNHNTEAYDAIEDNPFRETKGNELSTFSIDVDTASYANIRRFLQGEQLPPAGAVRIEELVNYFRYTYPQPTNDQPFSVNVEVSKAPWAPQHELVRIALKGQEIPKGDRGPANLVFLIDVSGSMQPENKLPLLKRSLKALVENIAPDDRVAIVVYAGSSGLVLPSTAGKDKTRILEALDNLEAGGSTNGAQGITLAYQTARENFLKGGNNRVILCTDGDFNVGVTNQSDLTDLIERERASGVFLSVLGFGEGNLKDSTMEKLADKGNGNYAYIDSFNEGRKVLVEQMNSTLFTIAKDVKVQVEFNPARVAGYRLIGYENRILAKEDFNDDRKDAGEIGVGHTVTALYEVVPTGQPLPNRPSVDPLKYSEPSPTADIDRKASGDLLTVKLRYKAPDGDTSKLIEVPVKDTPMAFDEASPDFQFAAAVAAFGMKLRNSPYAGDLSWSEIQKIARRNLGEDPGSYRAEFLTLIEKAARLQSGK